MLGLIQNGHAERVHVLHDDQINDEDSGHVWYIPHHELFHTQKTDKLRVIFDCSAKFDGQSLNDHFLQGPDLTNNILGVLCRFRQEKVAFMWDIELMFHPFKVKDEDRDYLRFLWWEDNSFGDPVVF